MSGRGAIGAIVAVACFAGAAPAMAATGPYGVTSDNVTHVRNIAKHADSSGARLKDGYFYITTGRDLSIYDVSTPENPQEVGSLVLPEVAEPAFAEEDVDTNGRILLVQVRARCCVIDVTDKTDPVVLSELTGAAVHTITCVMDCTYAYGDNGKIFDLRDPSAPTLLAKSWRTLVPGIESWHDVTEVAPGLILTASQPIALIDARMDPANPVLARTTAPVADRFVHATRWPRGTTDKFMLIGGEAIGPLCGDSDSATFSTWNADTFTEIDEYRAPTGLPSEGRAPDSTYCTHWFQEHPNYADGGLMAISWYEHGTKFLRVSSEGQITEDGYYLPNGGQASAAYWITDRVVYVADYLRGLDVLALRRRRGRRAARAPPPILRRPAPRAGREGGGQGRPAPRRAPLPLDRLEPLLRRPPRAAGARWTAGEPPSA